MLPAYNVIDLVRKARAVFMDQTVFTTPMGALDNQTPRLHHEPLISIWRARALAIRRICSRSMK